MIAFSCGLMYSKIAKNQVSNTFYAKKVPVRAVIHGFDSKKHQSGQHGFSV